MENNFVSIDEVVAIVKEELNSYFAVGAIDDVLIPKWVKFALKDFRVSALPRKSISLHLNNYTADLPEDFEQVDSLWACTMSGSEVIRNYTSFYYQTDCRITPITDPCNECFSEQDKCNGTLPPKQEKYRVTHKVTGSTLYEYYTEFLMKPASTQTRSQCHPNSRNLTYGCNETFTIRDCKIITKFPKGLLHLDYFGSNEDENGDPLIEDNEYIKEYLVYYLKYRLFEQLWNSTSDESANQLLTKMQFYSQKSDDAKVRAMDDKKKLTKYQVADLIKGTRTKNSFYRRSLR